MLASTIENSIECGFISRVLSKTVGRTDNSNPKNVKIESWGFPLSLF